MNAWHPATQPGCSRASWLAPRCGPHPAPCTQGGAGIRLRSGLAKTLGPLAAFSHARLAWAPPRLALSPRTLRVHPALQTLSVDLSPFLQCKPPFRGAGSSYLSLPPETLSDPTPPCPLSTQSTAGTSFILGDLAQTSWLALSIAPPPPPSRHHPFSFYYQNHA